MLTDFDATLSQLLVKRVPLNPAEVDISMECPTRAWSDHLMRPTISAYLFDLRQQTNAAAVKAGQPPTPTGPTTYELSYLISTWAAAPAREHDLLWRVMMALARESMVGPDLLQGALQKLAAPIKTATAQWDGTTRRATDVWASIDNRLRPGILFTAMLPVQLIAPPPTAPPVLTRTIISSDIGKRERRQTINAVGGIIRERAVEGQPQRALANVAVFLPQLGLTVITEGDGRYVLPRIPHGSHQVVLTLPDGSTVERELVAPSPSYNLEV